MCWLGWVPKPVELYSIVTHANTRQGRRPRPFRGPPRPGYSISRSHLPLQGAHPPPSALRPVSTDYAHFSPSTEKHGARCGAAVTDAEL